MVQTEFAEILDDIKILFMMPDFMANAGKRELDTWYRVFKDMDFERTREAVTRASKRRIYNHNLIAEICEDYREIEEADRKFEREITDRFDCLARSFGRPEGNEARELFDDLIKSDDRKKMMQKANWLRSAGWRESAANPDMTLVQFLKGVIK